jgi:hypothetical protein
MCRYRYPGSGLGHIAEYQALKDVEVVAMCDVDENLFADRLKSQYTVKGLRQLLLFTDLKTD